MWLPEASLLHTVTGGAVRGGASCFRHLRSQALAGCTCCLWRAHQRARPDNAALGGYLLGMLTQASKGAVAVRVDRCALPLPPTTMLGNSKETSFPHTTL